MNSNEITKKNRNKMKQYQKLTVTVFTLSVLLIFGCRKNEKPVNLQDNTPKKLEALVQFQVNKKLIRIP